jgi:hypothetical protein
VGIKAAVHGVDPEAVEEDRNCSVGFFCVCFLLLSVAAIICRSQLGLKLVSNQADTHRLARRGACAARCSLALSNAPTQVNGHEKIFTTDH